MSTNEQEKHSAGYLREIEKALSGFPQRTSAHNPESYIGGGQSRLQYLGLKVPHLREAAKRGFSFSKDDQREVVRVWDYVWHHSDCFEVMSLALLWFERLENLDIDPWPVLKSWAHRIDNWAHADALSSMYAKMLERFPKKIYPTLQKWNASRNPWLRRLSIVSLLYYSAQRKRVLPFAKLIPLIEAQLEFEHYYVQKGVGWALREMGNIYPQETYRFLEAQISRISPAAFSAATEKLTKEKKRHLKKKRAAS